MIYALGLIFQFHKGTIRTNIWTISHIIDIKFQFHKGTIRTVKQVGSTSSAVKFQFHKGTIRTFMRWALVFQTTFYFNSIKVRLEPYAPDIDFVFQFYFNSIKVRLERMRRSRRSSASQFQFHKGTIRTSELSAFKASIQSISIP